MSRALDELEELKPGLEELMWFCERYYELRGKAPRRVNLDWRFYTELMRYFPEMLLRYHQGKASFCIETPVGTVAFELNERQETPIVVLEEQ